MKNKRMLVVAIASAALLWAALVSGSPGSNSKPRVAKQDAPVSSGESETGMPGLGIWSPTTQPLGQATYFSSPEISEDSHLSDLIVVGRVKNLDVVTFAVPSEVANSERAKRTLTYLGLTNPVGVAQKTTVEVSQVLYRSPALNQVIPELRQISFGPGQTITLVTSLSYAPPDRVEEMAAAFRAYQVDQQIRKEKAVDGNPYPQSYLPLHPMRFADEIGKGYVFFLAKGRAVPELGPRELVDPLAYYPFPVVDGGIDHPEVGRVTISDLKDRIETALSGPPPSGNRFLDLRQRMEGPPAS